MEGIREGDWEKGEGLGVGGRDMRRGKKKVSKADAEFMKCKLSLNINPTFQELFLGIGKDFRFDNYSLNSLLDIEIYAKCSRHKKFFG